mgnify:CR=1 FL=1
MLKHGLIVLIILILQVVIMLVALYYGLAWLIVEELVDLCPCLLLPAGVIWDGLFRFGGIDEVLCHGYFENV